MTHSQATAQVRAEREERAEMAPAASRPVVATGATAATEAPSMQPLRRRLQATRLGAAAPATGLWEETPDRSALAAPSAALGSEAPADRVGRSTAPQH